ncbi:MAG: aldehyde dehydrogenase [Sphingomonadales bacterium]|nr:aldehyde dehydrogenase [Sphingomonadales bacterium]
MSQVDSLSPARPPIGITHPDKLFIGGAWVAGKSGRTIEVISPDTETVVARVVEADEHDMDRAVAAARRAFDEGPWPRMAPAARQAILRRMGEEIASREPELARAWTMQIGGLASVAPMLTAVGTKGFTHLVEIMGEFPFVERVPGTTAHTAIIAREPVGVVAAIAPWNGPFAIMASKLVNALVAGCTVIMKPAPETPIEAYILAEAAEAAGLPPGVVNLACGHREASHHLISNPGVDKVSFTGSTAAGKKIASTCGERIARVTLELGGKSAAILCDDFPLEEAAATLARTITVMSGQVCAMLSRAIVPRRSHDRLAQLIKAEMEKIVIGHSDDPTTQLGPLAMKRQLERVETYVEEGRRTADLVTGGNRPSHLNRGYFLEPTLFANVDNRSRIAQEEIFGPVLSLIPCEDEAEAIRIANESDYGLNGAVFTRNGDKAYEVARAVRTGFFGQNGMRMDPTLPFGGFKQSGIGREGGTEGLMAFLESKTILLDSTPSAFA